MQFVCCLLLFELVSFALLIRIENAPQMYMYIHKSLTTCNYINFISPHTFQVESLRKALGFAQDENFRLKAQIAKVTGHKLD